jgi:hypothetical protein
VSLHGSRIEANSKAKCEGSNYLLDARDAAQTVLNACVVDQRGGTLILPAPWYAVQLHELGNYNLVCGGIGHYRIPFEGSPFILGRVARGQFGTIRT